MAHDESVRLKKWFSIIPHTPDEVELRHGVWNPVSVTLTDDSRSGQLFRLLRRLDGSASLSTIASEEKVPRDEVEGLVDHLLNLGVAEIGPSSSLDYFLETTSKVRDELRVQHLRRVVLLGDSPLTRRISGLLSEVDLGLSVEIVPADDPGWQQCRSSDRSWLNDGLAFEEEQSKFAAWTDALIVYATSTVDPSTLRVLNRVCLANRIPWVHAAIDGPFLIVGPLFIPGRSACSECLDGRVLMNMRESASYQRYKIALAERQVVLGELPVDGVILSLLASHINMEIVNFCLTGRSFIIGKALMIHLPTMEFSYNELLRLPSCPACAPRPESEDTELYFDMATLVSDTAD